jgi:hypothetical protein
MHSSVPPGRTPELMYPYNKHWNTLRLHHTSQYMATCHTLQHICGSTEKNRTFVNGLSSHRSAIELRYYLNLVVIDGIEPSFPAYETSVLAVVLYHHVLLDAHLFS